LTLRNFPWEPEASLPRGFETGKFLKRVTRKVSTFDDSACAVGAQDRLETHNGRELPPKQKRSRRNPCE
jgi:hypothetical protein